MSSTAVSGLWSGYYTQFNTRFPFSIQLFFGNYDGSVKGEGTDSIGKFMINGSWNKDYGSVQFTKQYIGAHSVAYNGRLSHNGRHMDGNYTAGGANGDFHMEVS